MPADGLEALLGTRLLVGISYVKANGEVDEEVQFVGTVTSVDPLVAIDRGDRRIFTLPPDPDAFERAAPGEYRLRSTGEVVIDPDFGPFTHPAHSCRSASVSGVKTSLMPPRSFGPGQLRGLEGR